MQNKEFSRGQSAYLAALFIGALVVVASFALLKFREAPAQAEPVVVEVVSDEGMAKAMMIEELTGLRFTPDVAKWATITFSGTTVQIETHAINVWEGRHAGWREK